MTITPKIGAHVEYIDKDGYLYQLALVCSICQSGNPTLCAYDEVDGWITAYDVDSVADKKMKPAQVRFWRPYCGN